MMGLKFRDMLPASMVDELDQLVTGIRSYLFTEHHEDGTHAAIHADSIDVTGDATVEGDESVGGDLAVDGNITAQAVDPTALDTLGLVIETGVSDGSTGQGVSFGGTGASPGAAHGAVYTRDDGADKFLNFSFGTKTVFQVRLTAGEYFLQPGPVSIVGTTINLGGHRTLFDWWDTIYARQHFAQGRLVAEGEWSDVPYNAGDFTSDVGTWVVQSSDMAVYAYSMNGKTMTLKVVISVSSITGTPNALRVAIPNGYMARYQAADCVVLYNNGTWVPGGVAETGVGSTHVNIYKNDYGVTNWANSVNTFYLRMTLIIPVQ